MRSQCANRAGPEISAVHLVLLDGLIGGAKACQRQQQQRWWQGT